MPWTVRESDGQFCVVAKADGKNVGCHGSRDDAMAQVRALYAAEPNMTARVAEYARERDVNAPGGGHDLRNYWVRGEGAAKIRWGTDGSFNRCVSQLGEHVKNPQGLCAEYHKAATGEWPAEKGVESSVSGLEEFHGNHNQQDHNPHGRPNRAERRETRRERNDRLGEGNPNLREKIGAILDKVGSRVKSRKTNDDNDPVLQDMIKSQTNKLLRKLGSDKASDDDIGEYDGDDTERVRLDELEEKAEGLDLTYDERVELRKLRRMYGRDSQTGYDRYSSNLTAASKKRKASTETYADEPWEGTLVVEGTESGDGRLFAYGGLDWAQLPLPLMFQPANSGGHQESIMIGQIEHAARTADKINGWGKVFGQALAGEHGPTIRIMMSKNGPGGVSVDVDKVKDADVEMIYAEVEGNPFAKPETTIFHRGRIRGATLVAFPAFVEAKLAFTNQDVVTAAAEPSCGCNAPLTAASHTITIPDLPPAHWFNEPTDVEIGGALTITDEGRVFGLVAPSDTTHRNVKTKVPRNLDFSRFHKGETIVEGGTRVVTGVITADCGHAPTAGYGTLQNRIDHYDNSCSVLANVRVGYDRQGAIWVAGALNAGADPQQVARALGCTLSLDVQPHPDRAGVREFISAHLVPVPGFPLARTQASVQYNDGLITAAAVPVQRVGEPTPRVDMYEVVAMTKMALAQSIGRDPGTRKRELAAQLGGR